MSAYKYILWSEAKYKLCLLMHIFPSVNEVKIFRNILWNKS